MKIHKGDQIRVTAGKDRGKTGKVTVVDTRDMTVLVEGLNKVKKHVKPRGEGKPGGIIEIERPLSLAKVALLCPTCKQPTRVGYRLGPSDTKERICLKCKAVVRH